MITRRPCITGAAFASTTALVNIACAIAVALYPDAVLQIANTWVHGIDFTLIRRAAGNPLTFGAWAAGFITSVAFAFVVGVVYRWSTNLFERLATGRGTPLRAPSHG